MRNTREQAILFTHLHVESLEDRVVPATLVNPRTVTFRDPAGSLATVSVSQPVFDSSIVNEAFIFNTGSVNGDNSKPQQLEEINTTVLGTTAVGMSISVMATGGNGVVNVGYIYSYNVNLGSVTVDGDLGKINAGNGNAIGVQTLSVNSIGALGTITQQPGGDLRAYASQIA